MTKNNGIIVITGDKELGIDFYLGKISNYIDLNTIAQSHGKITIFKKPKFIPNDIKNWKNYGKFKKTSTNFYTLPGCFSEKEIDEGSRLLALKLSNNLHGRVADLGAGWGYLSSKALENNKSINQISLIESNLNALNCARINISNVKAKFHWTDIEYEDLNFKKFDHVIMNPPFHKGKKFMHSLVLVFIRTAQKMLAKKGTLWMVHNKNLIYEYTCNWFR